MPNINLQKNVIFINILAVFIICTFSVYYEITNTIESIKGSKTTILIDSIDPSLSNQEILEILNSYSSETDSNLFLTKLGFDNKRTTIDLFSIIGNTDLYNKSVSNKYYKSPSPKFLINLLDSKDIGYKSLSGNYWSTADYSTAISHSDILLDAGINARFSKITSLDSLVMFCQTIIMNKLYFILIALLIGIFYSLFYQISKSIKIINVYKLFGCTSVEAFFKIYKPILANSSIILIFGLLFFIVFQYFYNDLSSVYFFSKTYLIITLFILIFEFLCILLSNILLSKNIKIQNAIKGKGKNFVVNIATFTSQTILCILLFSLLSITTVNISRLSTNINTLYKFNDINNFYSFNLGYKVIQKSASEDVGNYFRDIDKSGNLLIVERQKENLGDQEDPENPMESAKPSNSLIVNNKFINKQPVISINGESIDDLENNDGKFYLLIPENLKISDDRIIQKSNLFLYNNISDLEMANNPTDEYIKAEQAIDDFRNIYDY
ncbi:MAG: hypothetical protein LBN03_00320, partial [Bifidobacteriaceae bacterium]|nr:hypothetical protein [Bifidobacteriaceae bacterium]